MQLRVRPKVWTREERKRARRVQRYLNWMIRNIRFSSPPGVYGLGIGHFLDQK